MKELQRPRDGQGGLWYRAGRSLSQSCEELSVGSGQAEQSKSGVCRGVRLGQQQGPAL